MVNSQGEPPRAPRRRRPTPRSTAASSGGQATTPRPNDFGDTLRRLREARELSQEQLAEAAGISVEAVSALERGKSRLPRKATRQRLAGALALPPAEYAAFEAAGYPRQADEPPIGREREWERIRRELTGERPMVVVAGRPGLGKSHLLEAAVRWAGARGWRVLWGGCHRGSVQESYAPITEAVKRSIRDLPYQRKAAILSECVWLARLLPELLDDGVLHTPQRTHAPDQERRLMFDAVVRYLENIGADADGNAGGCAGTLLVLDDVQWAGPDTMLLLAHLIRSARPGRIRVLAAYRTTEVERVKPFAALVAGLATDDRVVHVELAPLTPDDATRLASDLLRSVLEDSDERAGRELVRRLVERTDRIPLFLVHYAKSLRELAQERSASGEQAPSAAASATSREKLGARINAADLDRMPWSITQHVHQRLAALPPSTGDLLAVAAVATEATLGEVLAECLGRTEQDLLPDFEAACTAGLLVERPKRDGRVAYCFGHDLLRKAVREKLSAQRKMLLNRAMGEALERRLGDQWRQREDLYPRLAYHFARSGLPEKAATHLRLAADQARRMYAHQQAAAYYAALVACLDELRREREAAEARKHLAEELAHSGRTAEALGVLARAGDTYRALGDVESLAMVTAHIAAAHANRGTVSAGLVELVPLVEGIATTRSCETGGESGFSPTVRTWLLTTLSHLCFMDGRYEDALRVAELARDVAQTTGDTALIGRARLGLGVALFVVGRAQEAAVTLRLAISCAESASDRELLIESLLMSIWVAQTQGDFAASREMQGRVLAEAAEFGNPTFLGHACIFVGLLAFYEGNWDQARILAMHSADAFGQLDASQLGSYPPLGLGILCLVSGKREEAMRHVENARAIAERSDGEQVVRLIAALLAEDELVRGRGNAACARLIPVLEAGPLQERTRIELQTLYAWGTLLMGQVAEAEALAQDAIESAREHGMRLLLPDALRVRALCAIERNDWQRATSSLQAALALCEQMPYPYAEAKVRHVYGRLYLAMREPGHACEQFGQALSICATLGERMYGAAIEQALLRARAAEATCRT